MRATLGVIVCLAAIAQAAFASPRVDRVVILKVDGLPARLLEQYATGAAAQNRRPWIDEVFGRQGVWFESFYVRGLSISAPSWSLLDTGRRLEIRGNVEYDRDTLQPYDYLNFFPFYVGNARSHEIDMPGVELLDQLGVPLLIDRFPYGERLQGIQLLQRGVRWSTLGSMVKRAVARSPKELFDEWQIGFSMSDSFYRQNEQELLDALKNRKVRYLDLFTGEYDHTAHLTADRVTQMHAVDALDALVGRIWSAIHQSPWADSTVLVLVSDHGMNTDPGVYSQGYNLVDWFTSAPGGAHHVLTNRHPRTEFKLKGLDPFVSAVVTPSARSSYLAGRGEEYPTALLDLDGNERAGIGLRNNTLNKLHVLLAQLRDNRLASSLRAAGVGGFFKVLDDARPSLEQDVRDVYAALAALDARIDTQKRIVAGQPKQWTDAQRDLGLDDDALREANRLTDWSAERTAFAQYAATIQRLLALDPTALDSSRFRIEDVIPARSMGPANTVEDLQNYVVGPAESGLVASGGALDLDRSFRTVNYFTALSAISVRNNVQEGVEPRPVDFIAVRVPQEALQRALPAEDWPDGDAIWLWRSEDRQALILRRRTGALRYMPIAQLKVARGAIEFEAKAWGPGFPLNLWEDQNLRVVGEDRGVWLAAWHPEREWFDAIHRTRYSNGVIGLTEALLDDPRADAGARDAYTAFKRRQRRVDMIVFANDRWNFNVRGFNPGGNHGSFLRDSTRSVLLVAGGKDTGIPRGVRVATPYDSLSFVPTILTLMGRPEGDLPGPIIREVVPSLDDAPPVTGAAVDDSGR